MDFARALDDIAGFFARGRVTASDPRSPERGESGFGPTGRLLGAVLAGALALGALAGPAAAGPAADHAAAAPHRAVYMYYVDEGGDVTTIFDAPSLEACVVKANANIDQIAGVEVSCVDTSTAEHLGMLGMRADGAYTLPPPEAAHVAARP